jgi:glycosyltransferase involved in cell wall biosynthesis
LVLVGRLAPTPPGDRHELRSDVELVDLPHYGSLARPGAAISAMPRSLLRFWRTLGGVDTVWLLGPHPLALLFALVALARRKQVVLGVRQDLPAHMASRHPGRRSLYLAARALEGAWRALARFCPTIVVGPDLARHYRRARLLLTIVVSVVEDDELVNLDEALARTYESELCVLSVGRLDPEKNPLLLAEVLAQLREHDGRWRLVVCGDGTLAPELRQSLRAKGVDGHAELTGFVALPDLQKQYHDAHVLLHVSWTEGVPQVLFEAFSAGLPVVATDVGGVAEAAGEAALLIPPGDPEAAVTALRRVVEDADRRAELIARGLEIARRHTGAAERRRIASFLGWLN